ncbi:hypothetical protein VHEMI08899 [[Torrubiella] hemipterigena]|uniref:Uncharacterized protein n=1 Tax=[Torrubiella] hemipterigena TaxID=1531966 RepID=A0A0A1T880_9HYPO|nr:hypothetical protein VHEMI08899 [[Torrubiella] hemipterigena]
MSLVSLPAHLRTDILKHLPDAHSLTAARAAHPALHYAFNEHTQDIMESVIRNQIPQELLPFAQAAHDARCKPYSFLHATATLDDLYFHNLPTAPPTLHSREFGALSMPKLIAMGKMHNVVSYFTDRIADMMLDSAVELGLLPRPGGAESLSATERFVIQRALYRYEVFVGLFFGDGKGVGAISQRRDQTKMITRVSFLGHFAPWVNEQLASVYDCLEQILSEPFREVAEHDVGWGAQRVDWELQGRNNCWLQGLVSLQNIYEVATAVVIIMGVVVRRWKFADRFSYRTA